MSFRERFIFNFIQDARWRFILIGLQNTLTITFFALIFGAFLGFFVALARVVHDTAIRPGEKLTPRAAVIKALNWVAKGYLTVIRGTPTVVQLMIIYYVVFASVNVDRIVAAVIAFGINSGAYAAEVFRSGMMSIDKGQMEAGRSLGLSYAQTVRRIILPQAVKNVLPALGNEMITLLKETSIAGYIAVQDLTRGGDIIRSRTYDAFFPLITVALIYLTLVLFLQALVGRLERRLAKSDRR